jgi:hypothetical protein
MIRKISNNQSKGYPMPQEYQPHSQQTPLMSRRKALKLLVASGGAVTASALLSGQWMKPVVEVGLLPAHAQGSSSLTANANPTPCSIRDVTATMSPPVAGVEILMTYDKTDGADPAPGPTTAFTNGSGMANFGDLSNGFIDLRYNLVFSFVDQVLYGPATAQLGEFTGHQC